MRETGEVKYCSQIRGIPVLECMHLIAVATVDVGTFTQSDPVDCSSISILERMIAMKVGLWKSDSWDTVTVCMCVGWSRGMVRHLTAVNCCCRSYLHWCGSSNIHFRRFGGYCCLKDNYLGTRLEWSRTARYSLSIVGFQYKAPHAFRPGERRCTHVPECWQQEQMISPKGVFIWKHPLAWYLGVSWIVCRDM